MDSSRLVKGNVEDHKVPALLYLLFNMKLFVLLITLFALAPTQVIGFGPDISEVFDNTTGTPDTRFGQEIGSEYTANILFDASDFVLKTFEQTDGGGKNYTSIGATVTSFKASGIGGYPLQVAIIGGNVILLNADYVQTYTGDLKAEFTGILYHVSARVWQWTADGTAPNWLITGIADYVRLTSGWPSKDWVSRGSGSSWEEGYAVAAYFLEYCNGINGRFIAELNAIMRYSYSDAFFAQLLRKPVYDLWDDYKLQYGGNPPAPALASSSGC
ncbi:uncharacterized protein LOC115727863 [Rhodamnia argentea]|uniref:Uncharacterized protein LOC115727863 n=1 Tax=Rhodamnia argentea TaxID=178133 RepID=A0A8B8MVB4_9MYRT|nr:uncharacterized protein LOC115727863 [Rhodamnia argentea]